MLEVLLLLSFKIINIARSLHSIFVTCARRCMLIYLCIYVNDCMCTSEHFICVNKLKALPAIKRLAAHVSLEVSVISWHHAQQTDSCSDKSASGNGCVATIWLLQLQQPNSHSSGWYQLMEVSSCYCQYAVTRVWGPAHIIGMWWVAVWLDNNRQLTSHHTVSAVPKTSLGQILAAGYTSQHVLTKWTYIAADSWANAVVSWDAVSLKGPFPNNVSTH